MNMEKKDFQDKLQKIFAKKENKEIVTTKQLVEIIENQYQDQNKMMVILQKEHFKQ